MIVNPSSINLNIKSWYKYLSVSTLLSAFAQITLGGFVRTSESGLGCPDWPLCYGQIIPPMDFHTWVEWSHRLNASVLMMLVFTLCFFTLIQYKNIRVLKNFSVSNVILVIITAILGGITVITELAWWVRLIHLALAQSLIACLTVMTWYSFSMPHINKIEHFEDPKWKSKIIIMITLIYLLMISGSYMVGMGASSACSTWPLCRGEIFPTGNQVYAIHMIHRYIALIGLIICVYLGLSFYKKGKHIPDVKRSIHSTFGAITLQVIIGAWVIWSGFNGHIKTAHLSLATVVWVATIYLSVVIYYSVSKNNKNL